MKFFLISAALVAVAVAGPVFIQPGGMGPAPVEELESANPIYVGPALVEAQPNPTPVIQIIVNVNSQGQVEVSPVDVSPEIIDVPEAIEIPESAFPSPQPAPVNPELELPAPQPAPVIPELEIPAPQPAPAF